MIWWVVQTACTSALLAAVVALVGRAGRLSPAVKHALWLLVLVKLMTPPLGFYRLPATAEGAMAGWTEWLLRGGRWLPAESVTDTDSLDRGFPDVDFALADPSESDGRLLVDPDFAARADATAAPIPSGTVPLEPAPQPTCAAQTQFPTAEGADGVRFRRSRTVARIFVAVWLLGAVPLAVVQSLRVVRLRRFLARSTPTPAWLDEMVRQVAARLNIRPPQIAVVPALCSPLVCAFGRPRLLWPAGLSDQLPHEARQAVLLHELAHLRRRDHWVAWLELAAGVVWWFNPLYWYVRHQLRENAELACDAWVVGLLPAGRRAYAQALIEVSEFVSLAPAAMPAVAMGNVARRTLERRLTMIMRESTSYRVPLLGTGLIGLSLLAILPGWTGGQESLPALEKAPTKNAAKGPEPGVGLETPLLPALVRGSDEIAPDLPAIGSGGPRTDTPDRADKEQRIRQLEAQLNELHAAVQALRTVDQSAFADPKPAETPKPADMPNPAERQTKGGDPMFWSRGEPHRSWNHNQDTYFAQMNRAGAQMQGRAGYHIETLTRARYKLPETTANALASFIKEHVKDDVEARVAGDALTVIASQEDQAKIGAFIELLRDEGLPETPGQQKGNAPGSKPGTSDLSPARR